MGGRYSDQCELKLWRENQGAPFFTDVITELHLEKVTKVAQKCMQQSPHGRDSCKAWLGSLGRMFRNFLCYLKNQEGKQAKMPLVLRDTSETPASSP